MSILTLYYIKNQAKKTQSFFLCFLLCLSPGILSHVFGRGPTFKTQLKKRNWCANFVNMLQTYAGILMFICVFVDRRKYFVYFLV